MEEKFYDVIILGAGAAGLFCACEIHKSNSILILEKSSYPAQKLLLSAKGRGNITNSKIIPQKDYVSDNQEFVVSAFKKFGTDDFLEFLNNKGIKTKEEDNGRILLESGKVKEFHENLLKIIEDKGIEIIYNTELLGIDSKNGIIGIKTSNGIYYTKNFIIATGGPSFPKMGASAIAIDIAKQFNLKTTNFYPALVGFETNQNFSSLSGSSVIGKISLIKGNKIIYEEIGSILFTHRGISGPSIFNASLFMRESSKYEVKLTISSKEITKKLLKFLGFRANNIDNYIITCNITKIRGLDEAKVSGGGVKTENLNNNFECKNINGLYFIGECVDVTGKTGGFNLQWCWTSGAICAKSIDNKFSE